MKKVLLLLLVLFSGMSSARIVPADGLWRTADDPQFGSGLMLATEGDMTLVSVFTYDDEGNNAWYVATGQVSDEGLFSANLLQTGQGEYLLNENPQSAQVITSENTIKIQFSGSQVATLSIDESVPKTIRADHFGFATDSGIPDLSGKWVLGDAESGQSFVLDLINYPGVSIGLPYIQLGYYSIHPSTENWDINCIIFSDEVEDNDCFVSRGLNVLDRLSIETEDIGNQRMTLYNEDAENPENYQAFRLNKDRRLLPSDGHWRTYDDPAIGSGVVMRTQGDYTVVLLYSYAADGKAKWQIASGFFDETGKLVAELNTTQGGSSIGSETPVSATLHENAQTLEIQLQGTELATLKIDESELKYIQSFNFGVELFQTDHFKVENRSYRYPSLKGSWVYYVRSFDNSASLIIDIQNDRLFPTDIELENSQLFSGRFEENESSHLYGFETRCLDEVVDEYIQPYCDTVFYYGDHLSSEKNLFENMGYRHFKMSGLVELPEDSPALVFSGFYRLD